MRLLDRSQELRHKRQAVGFIEAEGLPAAIAAADAAVKSANVHLVSRENSRGGGYMTIKVVGEVGAVKAAIEAAKAVSDKVHGTHSVLVIPRPATGVHDSMIWNCNEYTTGIEPEDSGDDNKPEPPVPPVPPVPPTPPAPEPEPEPEPEPAPEVIKEPEPEPVIEEPKAEPEAVSEPEPEEIKEPEIKPEEQSVSSTEEAASSDVPFRNEFVEDGAEGDSGYAESASSESGDSTGLEPLSEAEDAPKPKRRSRRSKSK